MATVRVLKLADDDPEAERRFELDFLLSLTRDERVALMLERSRILREQMRPHERPDAAGVFKRT
jgi:hypothetical protein